MWKSEEEESGYAMAVLLPWFRLCVCVVFTDAFTDAYLQLGFTRIERYVCRCYCFI